MYRCYVPPPRRSSLIGFTIWFITIFFCVCTAKILYQKERLYIPMFTHAQFVIGVANRVL